MGRKVNKKSIRQKVFTYLDKQTSKPRQDVVSKVMTKFNIGRSYAMTLYQTHRKIGKATGTLTEVFTIRDYKDGKSVSPYVSSAFVAEPKQAASRSKSVAVKRYEIVLKSKIAEAKKL